MATFGQLLARQRGKQALQATLGRTQLQTDVQTEQKQLEAGRREYQAEVEKAEREMKKRAKKRGRRRLLGQAIGTGVGLVTGQPLLGAAVTGGVSGVGAALVPEYETTIKNLVPQGKFFSEARADFDADISSTNQFIKDAAEGQNLLDLTNALGDAYSSFKMTKAFGKDFDKFIGKRAEAARGMDAKGSPKVTFLEKTLGNIFNKGEDLQFFEPGTLTGGIASAAEARTKARELESLQKIDSLFGGLFGDKKFTEEQKSQLENYQSQGTLTFRNILDSIRGNE